MNTLPTQIKNQFTQLLEMEEFSQNISYYTKVALQSIYQAHETNNQKEVSYIQEKECPSAYLFVIAHYNSNGVPLQGLAQEFPSQETGEQYLKAVRILQKQTKQIENRSGENRFDRILQNQSEGNLVDVKYSMKVQEGRQIWIVELYVSSNMSDPIVMKLNYEELSLFSFKVNQIVGHVKSIDLQSIV